MANYISTYCENCGRETIHKVTTEDFWELDGGWKILGAVMSLGATLVDFDKYSTCCSCGERVRM